ncbi:MAG: N-acetyl-gamma-glutamyl-phosphate reductase [Hyphomonas sp. TMED17]|nr:MAG: N-acetyl-gamma-glutamyl-phosphate reductase [Hyphomonas sp. TMED17]
MTSDTQLKAAVLGASGYTGAETVRLLQAHRLVTAVAASGSALAGRQLSEIFPHLAGAADMPVEKVDDINWAAIDIVFSCLPHGTSQDVIETLPDHVKVIDLSADYRLRDAGLYANTYGRPHSAPQRLVSVPYGLPEWYGNDLKGESLVACPGCYPTATLLALLPLVANNIIDTGHLIVDAKSGVSGAGRGLKEGNLFSEAAEGFHAYGVGTHRHAPEIEQELSRVASGGAIEVTFTPHLIPTTRGELVTCHVRGDADRMHAALAANYATAPFVHVLPFGAPPPDTRHVRGTNHCRIAVYPDRVKGRAIVIAVIDNLVKGSSGQAIQNLNWMMGWDEALGLDQLQPLFP